MTLVTYPIEHPSPVTNEHHATLSCLVINDPVVPIIAAAEYHHHPTRLDPTDLIESLLNQAPSWLTIELVAAGYHFATDSVIEFLSSKSYEFIILGQWNHRHTHQLKQAVDDVEDEPPNIVWCDAHNTTGHCVFLRDQHRSNAVLTIEDEYDLFLTRLTNPLDEPEFRELTRVFEGISHVHSLLDKAVSNGITEDHCLQYLALINYTAAATLSETSADL